MNMPEFRAAEVADAPEDSPSRRKEKRAVSRALRRARELEVVNETLRHRVAELEALTDQEPTTSAPLKGIPDAAELSRKSQPDLVNMVLRLQRKVQALNKRLNAAERRGGKRP